MIYNAATKTSMSVKRVCFSYKLFYAIKAYIIQSRTNRAALRVYKADTAIIRLSLKKKDIGL